jgi:hypothetical protein
VRDKGFNVQVSRCHEDSLYKKWRRRELRSVWEPEWTDTGAAHFGSLGAAVAELAPMSSVLSLLDQLPRHDTSSIVQVHVPRWFSNRFSIYLPPRPPPSPPSRCSSCRWLTVNRPAATNLSFADKSPRQTLFVICGVHSIPILGDLDFVAAITTSFGSPRSKLTSSTPKNGERIRHHRRIEEAYRYKGHQRCEAKHHGNGRPQLSAE